MTELHDTRLRRLHMRSWRRGMKEMDLILGGFANGPLRDLGGDLLDDYEALLHENDQDLYLWVSARTRGAAAGPDHLARILDVIAEHAAGQFAKS